MIVHNTLINIIFHYFSRLTTDHHSYGRAKVHLSAFRRVLSRDLGQLVDSQHWPAVAEYAIQAWEVRVNFSISLTKLGELSCSSNF